MEKLKLLQKYGAVPEKKKKKKKTQIGAHKYGIRMFDDDPDWTFKPTDEENEGQFKSTHLMNQKKNFFGPHYLSRKNNNNKTFVYLARFYSR
jgi:hypothetical protein